jgi:hypothetical protein
MGSLWRLTTAKKRRDKGEGSIYRRKEGRWVGQYEVNGKRRYLSGKTRTEVARKLTRAIAERDAGLVFDAEGLTVGEYLTRWLDPVRSTVKDNTWKHHEINVRVHLSPALGGTKLDRLNPFQVQSFWSVASIGVENTRHALKGPESHCTVETDTSQPPGAGARTPTRGRVEYAL